VISSLSEESRDSANRLVSEAAKAFFIRAGKSRFGIDVAISGEVPVGRGLGASAIARLGVIAGLNEIAGTRLDRHQMLELVTELEGHPDNASPATFGGFTVAGKVEGAVRLFRFPVSTALRFITLFPRFEIDTREARKLVPASFTKLDTVHSLNRAALISAAFASQDYGALQGLFDDRVHQPYRQRLIPQLSEVIRAGVAAGAIGGWLSGSGSAIMCLTLRNPFKVARAMQDLLPESDLKILSADNHGFRILRA
jgi:homoserine kinase